MGKCVETSYWLKNLWTEFEELGAQCNRLPHSSVANGVLNIYEFTPRGAVFTFLIEPVVVSQ